jgi:molybdopterin biosynthesis enzyme MoaB
VGLVDCAVVPSDVDPRSDFSVDPLIVDVNIDCVVVSGGFGVVPVHVVETLASVGPVVLKSIDGVGDGLI